MKGKIVKTGFLDIYRGGVPKDQFCIHRKAEEDVPWCGDWCPQFSEPEKETVYVLNFGTEGNFKETGKTLLTICQGRTLTFDEFEDER